MKRPLESSRHRTVSTGLEGKLHAQSARASLFIGLTLFGLSAFGSGCTDSISSADNTADYRGPIAQADVPRFEMSDLPASLSLTVEQKQSMQQALDDLNATRARWHERFRGEGKKHARRLRGDAGFEGAGSGPPLLTFLEQSAEILEPEQFKTLAGYLTDHPEEWRPLRLRGERTRGRGWDNGRGRGRDNGPDNGREPRWGREQDEEGGRRFQREHGVGARLGDALGLDDAQREGVREKLASFREDMRALVRSVEAGERTAEAAIGEGTARVETMRADLASILTPEQLAQMEGLRRDHLTRRIDDRIENLDESLSRRATFLDRVLGLDDTQAQQVRGLLLATASEREALIREVESGALEPHLAPLRILQIEESTLQRIRGVLTPEQEERLELLKDLLPRGGGRFMHG